MADSEGRLAWGHDCRTSGRGGPWPGRVVAMKTCSVCPSPHHAIGYCIAHYRRLKRHGDPFGGKGERRREDFWSFVDVGDCWEWTGPTSVGGYGKIRWACFEESYTHRVSWTMLVTAIPPGMFIDHLCRNRKCCNPDHLEVVTHQTNMGRGFSPTARLSKSGLCKKGHEQTPENTHRNPSKKQPNARACSICRNERRRTRDIHRSAARS